MRYGVLGPLEVLSDGYRPLNLGGPKQRALLAALLLNANEVVSRDRLIDALWEDDPPESAQKALQVHVSSLRKLVGGERLETRPPGYSSRCDDELDLGRFRRLRGRESCSRRWRSARSPLADFAFHRFAQAEIARLDDLRLACLEERIDSDLDAGRHTELGGELEALVAEHPLRERFRGQLCSLCTARPPGGGSRGLPGRGRALVEELGIEPGRPLRELHRAILRQEPARPRWRRARGGARGAFVGRERELGELLAGLDDAFAGRGRLFLLAASRGSARAASPRSSSRTRRARGAHVLVGRCWEAGGAPAYWPWVQSSARARPRGATRDAARAARRRRRRAGADPARAARAFSRPPRAGSLEPEGARFRLFDATAEFLRSASEGSRWCSSSTTSMRPTRRRCCCCGSSRASSARARMLVVGAFPRRRSGAAASRSPRSWPSSHGSRVTADLPRRPERKPTSRDYVELTASEIASPELVAALHEETEGNPLFVGEIVRLLAARRRRPEITERLSIPQSVRDVIARPPRPPLGRVQSGARPGIGVGTRVRARRARSDRRFSEDELLEMLDEAMIARSSRTSRHARPPSVRPCSDPRHALRGADDRPAGAAPPAGRRGARGPLRRRARASPRRARVPLDRGQRLRAGRSLRPARGRPRARVARLRGGRAAVRDGARGARPVGPAQTRAALRASLSLGDADSGRETPVPPGAVPHGSRYRATPRPRSRARPRGGGVRREGSCGREPATTNGSCRCSRKGWRRWRGGRRAAGQASARLAGALRDEHSRNRRDALSREAVELARRAGDLARSRTPSMVARCDRRARHDRECLALGTELRDVACGSATRARSSQRTSTASWRSSSHGDMTGARARPRRCEPRRRRAQATGQLWQVRSASRRCWRSRRAGSTRPSR